MNERSTIQSNLIDSCIQRNQHHLDRVALSAQSESMTFGELRNAINRVCSILANKGLKPGDRVFIQSQDSIEYAVTLCALMKSAMLAINANPGINVIERQKIIDTMRPKLVVYCKNNEADIQAVKTNCPDIEISSLFREVKQTSGQFGTTEFIETNVPDDTPAICFFTSGTTGSPKPVVHTHSDILFTIESYGKNLLNLSAEDSIFTTSKLFFAYGFNAMMFGLYFGGGTTLSLPQFDVSEIYETLKRNKPSCFFSVPTVYLKLIEKPIAADLLSSVKYFISAGENLPIDINKQWKDHYGQYIIDGIGCTESLCTYISNRPNGIKLGATGKVVDGFKVKIINESGQHCEADEPGVLWLSGPSLINHYFDNANCEGPFKEGWFKTNDMFQRDAEGWFYYLGRANDMIKVGGEWLSPLAIEAVLNQHDLVLESVVVMQTMPGQNPRPAAFVLPKHPIEDNLSFIGDLKSYCKIKLSSNQHPHFINVVDNIPKTLTGKLKRYTFQ